MAHYTSVRRPPIIIEPPFPSQTSPATLIFIHGYNFFATDFNADPPNKLSVAYHIHSSPRLKHLKIIVPEGLPCIHPSVDKKVWYNIDMPVPLPGDPNKAYELVEYGVFGRNEGDMNVSLDYFESLIDAEVSRGTPAERIVFMGDSQGATILLLFILTRRRAADIGAIISYAGFAPTPMQSISQMQRHNSLDVNWSKGTRLFMLHGKEDVFVPLEVFREWLSRLEGFQRQGQGISSIEWKLVDGMKHSLTAVLWPHVREILERIECLIDSKSAAKL